MKSHLQETTQPNAFGVSNSHLAERLEQYKVAVDLSDLRMRTGRITQFYGAIIEASGPEVFLGELCEISSDSMSSIVPAEVVGFRNGQVLLMPYGDIRGIRPGSEVTATGRAVEMPVGEALLGRIVDSFGQPLDDAGPLNVEQARPIYAEAINPTRRQAIDQLLSTGVGIIDSMLSIGRGQRVGIFAGSGVGKSTLMGMVAQNINADVIVVAMIGERGREVQDFVTNALGVNGLKKSVVIAATADQPALFRSHAAFSATTVAEYFCAQGKNVVLLMDSITRFAMAQREIGLSIGEPPTARGYTPSVFSALPKFVERCGNFIGQGSITAFYTVLVEGDDLNEPLSDSLRAALDGHIVLTREIANRGRYPAVDVLQSKSRLMPDLVSAKDQQIVQQSIGWLNAYEESRDMIELGAYEPGSNNNLDKAIKFSEQFEIDMAQSAKQPEQRSISLQKIQKNLRAIEQLSSQIGKNDQQRKVDAKPHELNANINQPQMRRAENAAVSMGNRNL